MAMDQVIAINDAVHKIQLAMLDGISDQMQLLATGNLMSRLDYDDIVTERTIAKLCGYPLCRESLPSDVSRRGKYRISLKEHKVYDAQETRKFCSAGCLINSRAFSKTLQDARTSEFDMVKLNKVLCLFDDQNAKASLEVVKEDLGLSKLTIRENIDVRGGELSLEQWMGSSSAVEGYVPFGRSNCKPKIDSKAAQKKHEEPPFSDMDFTSTVVFPDGYGIAKLPPQTKQPSPVGESEEGQGKNVPKEEATVPPTKKKSRFRRQIKKERKISGIDEKSSLSDKGKTVMTDFDQTAVLPRNKPIYGKDREMEKGIKNCMLDEMGLESSAIMSDGYAVEYSVSKLPPCSMEDPLSFHREDSQTLDRKNALLESSSSSNTKGLRKKPGKLGKKVTSVEYHADSCEDGGESLTAESSEGLKAHQYMCSSSETVTKSCLKKSGSKKLSRSVTWADQNDGRGDLCEIRSNDIEDVDSVSRLALAEACATALSQAAEAVSSGDLDARDAAAKAGIVLLPSTHQLDQEVSEQDIEEEIAEEEATLLKWPSKPGMPDSDIFNRDHTWFDGPPEGFTLTLSTFAMMWDSLFGWVSSSSLAYIYGKDESAHEEFLTVNGKEYPRRIFVGDGLSSEIKGTIAGCLARALPRVATDLRLPIPISELEKGLGSLLETMSLTVAVPSFGVEQWQVIILLFLDALSVSRIPPIAPYVFNRNKVLEGSGIGNEEYETIKDILLPLGRAPQLATRSGA